MSKRALATDMPAHLGIWKKIQRFFSIVSIPFRYGESGLNDSDSNQMCRLNNRRRRLFGRTKNGVARISKHLGVNLLCNDKVNYKSISMGNDSTNVITGPHLSEVINCSNSSTSPKHLKVRY